MTRAQTLNLIAFAGYHGDKAEATRLYVDAKRVGYAAFEDAFRRGREARSSGLGCGCRECKPTE